MVRIIGMAHSIHLETWIEYVKSRLLFVMLLLVVSSCGKEQTAVSNYVKQQIGKKININTSHYGIGGGKILDSLFEESQLMILTTIRKNACPSCYFSTILEMCSVIDSCFANRVNCVVFTPEHFDEYVELKREYGLSHIFFINDCDDFYTNDNKLDRYTAEYRTFLVNRKRKIIIAGNPFLNINVRKLYEREINILLYSKD